MIKKKMRLKLRACILELGDFNITVTIFSQKTSETIAIVLVINIALITKTTWLGASYIAL